MTVSFPGLFVWKKEFERFGLEEEVNVDDKISRALVGK